MKFLAGVLLALWVSVGVVGGARAQELANKTNDSSQIGMSTGIFNVSDDDAASMLLIDYRSNNALFGTLRPIGGVMLTTDSAVYGYGGLMLDVLWGEHFATSLYSSVGAFGKGHGEDLGSVVEFRSGVEVSYRFDNHARVGLGFSHMSNADIGDHNPGAEILSLTYTVPVETLFN